MNPWSLPLEERPPLFDPCAEIPIEAIEEGVGSPVEVTELLTRHDPGELMTCGWENEEVHLVGLGTWKSRDQYLTDRMFDVVELNHQVAGSSMLQLTPRGEEGKDSCLLLRFTERGTIWIKLDLVGLFNEFRDKRMANACDVLDVAAEPLLHRLPEGKF